MQADALTRRLRSRAARTRTAFISRAPARVRPQSAELFVRERGEGEPFVLLHGLASSNRYWGDMEPLAARHHVIAPDLLGFGRSPKPNDIAYAPAEHLAALRPALRRAGGPFRLLGHSLGSLIALNYAVEYPEDVTSLVLVSLPVLGDCAWGHTLDGGMSSWHRFTVHSGPGQRLMGAGMLAVRPLWHYAGPRLRRQVPPDACRDALSATWTSYWRSLEEVVYGTNVPSLITRVQAPVLLIHGPRDSIAPIGPVRGLATANPRLRLIEIPGAGHNPYFSHLAESVAAIEGGRSIP
jgi:pimeloyl-ACP methyl ester carboxylesterase